MFKFSDSDAGPSVSQNVEVKLDGVAISVPADRHSIHGIFSYLEMLALGAERLLCSLIVDGCPIDLSRPLPPLMSVSSVEATTSDLEQMPLQLVVTARQQTMETRRKVIAAVSLVMINPPRKARELWWNIAPELKNPLLTLSLMPDSLCGPENGRASLSQLRKWQFQQIAMIMQEVEIACGSNDLTTLSNVLENRVLLWIDTLLDTLGLWQETLIIGQQSKTLKI
jgi:hypothetical protein